MFKHKHDKKHSVVVVSAIYKYDEFKTEFDKLVSQASSKIKVPGYRPGKAPKEQLLARIDYHSIENKIFSNFLDKNKNEIFKYLDDKKIKFLPVFSNVDIKDKKDKENKDLEIEVSLPTIPDFENIKFDDVKVKFELPKITKEDIEVEMSHFTSHLTKKTEVKEKDAKSQLHDTVNIDFKGFINNEPFEGGEASGYDLELGSNSFISGFEDQLLNKKVGYKGDVKVKFPKNYFVKEYADKDAVFEVKINKIFRQDSVKVDDEMIKNIGIKNVSSLKDFEKYTSLKLNLEQLSRQLTNYVNEVIFEGYSKFDTKLNEIFFKERVNALRKDFEKRLESFGIKKREYITMLKSSEEEIEKEFVTLAEKEVAIEFVREAIMKDVKKSNDWETKYAKEFEILTNEDEAKNISLFLSMNESLLTKIGKDKEAKELVTFISKKLKF
nr:trigger factor [Mycoplasmopsis canis]WQQ12159.1 trigger factor [Mycoplasmopsis canis]